jgi:hypothetical protein
MISLPIHAAYPDPKSGVEMPHASIDRFLDILCALTPAG